MVEPEGAGEQKTQPLQAVRDRMAKLLGQRSHTTLGVAAIVGGVAALIAVLGVWAWIYWGLPSVPDGKSLWSLNRRPGITFLDREGRTLGVRGPYYGRRIALSDLPEYVPQAFLAIEDRRFYQHRGVDRAAVLRAFFANMAAGRTVQGGSTITQQLARNLFLTPKQTLRRKVQEMVLASRIEQLLAKDDILELYLNRVYFGDQAFGIDAAARRFFGKAPQDLTVAEAAMLAGLPKAPSRTAPSQSLERATERQHQVLLAMVEARYITEEQRQEALKTRINVARSTSEGALGYAFDMAFAEACNHIGRNRDAADAEDQMLCPAEPGQRKRYPPNAGDLVITLSINRQLQQTASRIVSDHLGARARNARHPLQAAMVMLDRDGAVRVLIGGADYARSKYNRVVQARRQPGSSFKAFVYAAAIERGLDTEEVRYDEPVVINGWRPQNYDQGYRGAVTLRTAFAQSINTVAAQVVDEIGPREVADLAERFGVSSMPARGKFVPPSIALGTIEVTLWDMTKAFGTFMLEGRRVDPYLVERIETSSGEALYARAEQRPRIVYEPELAHRMTSMLGAVVLNGTGVRAQLSNRDAAGKTGTSQDWRDAWFIGYTADYVAGVWVGLDADESMLRPFGRITGGATPAEIWHDVMTVAHRGTPVRRLVGIEQPDRTPEQLELATFYDSLKKAFSDIQQEFRDEPPPDDFFR
ncbi:MAG: PBP1A family penicillin-binding protein [Hyphomonadaceae bacterium]|nr:PBP1A family penicillin-binding protein [Hyphomonadaceae bacterium]